MSACLCDQCAALCCRYFALPIDNPEDENDYDNIRWYLLHEKVVIFVESEQWYIGIQNRCKQVQSDNRCGIYLTRPAICRSYTTDNCDYHAGDYGYDHLFTSAEAFWEFAQKKIAEDKAMAKVKEEKKVSRATRARRISQTLGLPAEALPAGESPAVVPSNAPPAPGVIALPILQK